MIDRPLYMNRIRPFIGKNIIKVLIGARRSGKSTLLELIRRQLLNAGVPENAMLHLNFESSSHMEAMLALVDNMASLPVMTIITRETSLAGAGANDIADWPRINAMRTSTERMMTGHGTRETVPGPATL